MNGTTNFNSVETDFRRVLSEYAARSNRSLHSIMKKKAKAVIKRVIQLTPPGGKFTGTAAKNAGRNRIAFEMNKMFAPVLKGAQASSGPSVAEMEAMRQARRRPNGRTQPPSQRIKVKKANLRQLIKKLQKKVGYLASGWKSGASALGAPVPSWISVHSGTGSYSEEIGNAHSSIKALNTVQYANDVAGAQARVDRALLEVKNSMINEMQFWLNNNHH